MKEMIKKYRGSLICSVLVMLIGVLVGFTSTQSMWANVFFVVTDCALVAIIFYDNRNRQQSRKIIGMTMWIIPIITLLYNGIARLVNMGADMENLFMAVIYYGTGLLFMIIGNYLPKVKQNNIIGIRVVWSLMDEENWNATHRFSGKLWMASGILCMLCGLFGEAFRFVVMIVILTLKQRDGMIIQGSIRKLTAFLMKKMYCRTIMITELMVFDKLFYFSHLANLF